MLFIAANRSTRQATIYQVIFARPAAAVCDRKKTNDQCLFVYLFLCVRTQADVCPYRFLPSVFGSLAWRYIHQCVGLYMKYSELLRISSPTYNGCWTFKVWLLASMMMVCPSILMCYSKWQTSELQCYLQNWWGLRAIVRYLLSVSTWRSEAKPKAIIHTAQ